MASVISFTGTNIFSLFDFLPPLALILVIGTVMSAREFRLALWALIWVVILLTILGLMQISGGLSNLHFYKITNLNSAVGFFSNANHYGVYLLMTIPIVAFLANYSRNNSYGRQNGPFALCVVAIIAALLGVGISGSLGSYLLIIPIFAAILFLSSSTKSKKQIFLTGIIISLIGGLLFDMFVWNGLQSELTEKFTSIDKTTRQNMFDNTFEIGKMFFPFGSGPGSFPEAYRLVEGVTRKTIPHAQNDYIEIFAEFGFLGIMGIFCGLFWVLRLNFQNFFKMNSRGSISNYMLIAVSTVMLHSLFDYSLRTIAVIEVTALKTSVKYSQVQKTCSLEFRKRFRKTILILSKAFRKLFNSALIFVSMQV